MVKRAYNFYAGPATLPLPALKKAQEELLNFKETGMSLMEISHRSKEYAEVHTQASASVRELMKIPDNYKARAIVFKCSFTHEEEGRVKPQSLVINLNTNYKD